MFAALVRLAIAILLLALAPGVGLVVSAQSTPEDQRYGRDNQGYASQFTEVLTELDAFWIDNFEASTTAYRTPTFVPLEQRITTGCGPAGPDDHAFYRPSDEGIYYSPAWFLDRERGIGDFVPIVVMAHEWDHHVQWLLGVVSEPGNAFELQADCLAGAYASEAGQQGLLDPGDVTETVAASADFGDPLGCPKMRL
jgi:predicted metalloprotease